MMFLRFFVRVERLTSAGVASQLAGTALRRGSEIYAAIFRSGNLRPLPVLGHQRQSRGHVSAD
jgi:hypothetical protein